MESNKQQAMKKNDKDIWADSFLQKEVVKKFDTKPGPTIKKQKSDKKNYKNITNIKKLEDRITQLEEDIKNIKLYLKQRIYKEAKVSRHVNDMLNKLDLGKK